MAFSGGVFSRLYDWTTDRDNGVKILASRMDEEFDGMATGLSTCILKDGTQTCTAAVPFAEGLTIPDDKTLVFGTDSDVTIQYDETTNNALEIAANVEGAALGVVLKADQGDDNADQWKVNVADGGTLSINSKISGSFVSQLTLTPNATAASSTTAIAGNITVGGTVDGRDLATDGSKLDGIEASADVTDTANVTAAGALMDSEVTNLAQVKAFNSADYATAAQGSTADSALQNVSEDNTPQLGGNLDVQTNSIVSTSNRDINISPNGTGTVVINTDLDVDNININGNTISSTDTNGDITLDPDGTGDVIVASGNLGVNTTSPDFPLTIENSANHLYLKQSNQDNGWLINTADADGELHISRRGEGASPSNNERLTISTAGNATFTGYVGAEGGNAPSGGFHLKDTGGTSRPRITNDGSNATVIRAGSATGDVKFNNFANTTELVHIKDDGKVGINTSSPATQLEIDGGGSSATFRMTNDATAAASGGGLDISINNSLNVGINNQKAGYIAFNTSNAERMKIEAGGEIFIKGEGSNTTSATQGVCKQWVKYDSTGTFEVDDSFNTSSVTDNGTGNAQPNINNDFANVDYATSGSCNEPFGNTTIINITTYAAGSYLCLTQADASNTRRDVDFGVATSFGDLS